MSTRYLHDQLIKFKLNRIWGDAWDWYSFDGLSKKYHNLRHAEEVVANVFALKKEPSISLLIAAKWHDAVYVPQAGSDANERCSAAALNVAYQRAKCFMTNDEIEVNNKIIENAKFLIINTAIPIHLTKLRFLDEDGCGLAYLLDADLGSLAAPYEQFKARQVDIIAENFGTVEEHSKQSANFLSQFLTVREFIYHTDEARGLWEEQARDNITRYMREVS